MAEKKEYLKELEGRMVDYQTEIEDLKNKAKSLETEERISLFDRVEELMTLKRRVEMRLYELRKLTQNVWEDKRIGIERAEHELAEAISSTSDKYKE
jgi:hypothetical protein